MLLIFKGCGKEQGAISFFITVCRFFLKLDFSDYPLIP